jgi:cell division protein FtsW
MSKKTGKIDYWLLSITFALLIFGLVVLYSASTVQSYNNFGNTTYFIKHQLLYGGCLGVLGMLVLSQVDYHFWKKMVPAMLFISLFLLLLVKVPGLSFAANGASRWIHVGPILFQPSELAKLVIVFYIAAWADKKGRSFDDFYFGFLPSLFIVGLYAVLILIQPDFGTMLVLLSTAGILLFISGVNLKYFFWTIVSGVLGLLLFIKIEPYRARRITSFFDPSTDPQGISYQINQALIAIGSGKWVGYGYGMSRQKYNYLPEAISDSVFAVLAEELGFLRVLAVLGLFIAFVLRGFHIAKNAPDVFGKITGIGIVSFIAIQALINIGAMVNILPLTGIPLPFFSYGSTSLFILLCSIGVLLNISKQSNIANT